MHLSRLYLNEVYSVIFRIITYCSIYFEGIFGSLKGNIRYTLHQIPQNRHDKTEYKQPLQNEYDVLFSIGSLNRKLIGFHKLQGVFSYFL